MHQLLAFSAPEDTVTTADRVRAAGLASVLTEGRIAEKRLEAYKHHSLDMADVTPEMIRELKAVRNKERAVYSKLRDVGAR